MERPRHMLLKKKNWYHNNSFNIKRKKTQLKKTTELDFKEATLWMPKSFDHWEQSVVYKIVSNLTLPSELLFWHRLCFIFSHAIRVVFSASFNLIYISIIKT